MPDETALRRELPKLKRALTLAKKGGDPKKIKAVVAAALARFEEIGFPDCWHAWERAREDAEFAERRAWPAW